MTTANCQNQVTPAGGATKAFHSVGWKEFSAVVVVDENGNIVNTFDSGLTDQQLRATPVPVLVTFPATQPVSGTVTVANPVTAVTVSRKSGGVRGSGAVAAPAASAVIADTGALPAGEYFIEYNGAAMDTVAVGKGMVVEHRNAANAATTNRFGGCVAGGSMQGTVERVTLATNERVRIIAGTAAGAVSSLYVGYIAAYPVP